MRKCIKCGSHAFNLYAEEIDQGGFCDVHYWQGRAHRAEAQLEQEQVALVLAEREAIIRYFDGHWRSDWSDGQIIEALEARGNC